MQVVFKLYARITGEIMSDVHNKKQPTDDAIERHASVGFNTEGRNLRVNSINGTSGSRRRP